MSTRLLRDQVAHHEFPDGDARAQEAFQDFRKRVNDVRLVLAYPAYFAGPGS